MRSLDKPSQTKSNPRTPSIVSRTASDAYAKAPSLFTPKTTKPVPPRARPPLRSRDSNQNAPSLNRPATNPRAAISTSTRPSPSPTIAAVHRSSTSTSRTNMPVGGGGDNLRPRQPQLSAAAARAGNRPPLTPKVASSKSSTTPLPSVSPLGARRQPNEGGPSFLANITSRTGNRQARVESAGSTPSGTPNPEKAFDGWDAPKVAGLGVSTPGTDGGKLATQAEDKFFHASDARPKSQGNTQQRPASVPQKPATFFYANASSAEAKRTTSPPSGPMFTPVLASTPEPTSTKFFYANGTPDQPARPGMTTSASTSTVSTNSKVAHQRPSTGSSAPILGPSAGSRPMSPVKNQSTPSVVSSLQGSALPPGPMNRPSITSPPSLAPTSNPNGKRRVSIETPAREPAPLNRGHSRTGSVPTLDQLIVPKYARSPQSPETMSPPLSPGLARPTMTMASLLQAAEELQGDDESGGDDSQPEAPQSPTKSAHGSEPVSELVANARRERKVQDLEITNASLEAINRTLERQLRKQTAELRRYRRLSRAGRLSAPSSRVASAAMTEPPIDLSDLSEENHSGDDEPDSLHESDFSSEEDESADELSADAKMAARRKRDELRLQLDLSKHQELLIDSQKINQSIKRCLDWTENLIKEGNKALEYHVRVSDVELGGHVLAPPDEEEDDTSFQVDHSSKPPSPGLQPPTEKPTQQGRDSGVELPPQAVPEP